MSRFALLFIFISLSIYAEDPESCMRKAASRAYAAQLREAMAPATLSNESGSPFKCSNIDPKEEKELLALRTSKEKMIKNSLYELKTKGKIGFHYEDFSPGRDSSQITAKEVCNEVNLGSDSFEGSSDCGKKLNEQATKFNQQVMKTDFLNADFFVICEQYMLMLRQHQEKMNQIESSCKQTASVKEAPGSEIHPVEVTSISSPPQKVQISQPTGANKSDANKSFQPAKVNFGGKKSTSGASAQ